METLDVFLRLGLLLALSLSADGCKPNSVGLRKSIGDCLKPSLTEIVQSPDSVIQYVLDDSKWFDAVKENVCIGENYTPECWISSLIFLLDRYSPLYKAAAKCICDYSGSCKLQAFDTISSDGLCQRPATRQFTLTKMRFSNCIAQEVADSRSEVTSTQTSMGISISTFLHDHYSYCKSDIVLSYSMEQRMLFHILEVDRACPRQGSGEHWRDNIMAVYEDATKTDSSVWRAINTCKTKIFSNFETCSEKLCATNSRCVDRDGFAVCECNEGYEAATDGLCQAVEKDPCKEKSCPILERCFAYRRRAYCLCDAGLTRGKSGKCESPCVPNRCQNGGACRRTGTTTTVCTCQAPYSGEFCEINSKTECFARYSANCHEHATCRMITQGNYQCRCNSGYEGDGFKCDIKDADPCKSSLGRSCHAMARCRRDALRYSCICMDGYKGNGFQCTEMGDCEKQHGRPCSRNGRCRSVSGGGFKCSCLDGFLGDGFTCQRMVTEIDTEKYCLQIKSVDATRAVADPNWFQKFVDDLSEDLKSIWKSFSGFLRAEFGAEYRTKPDGRVQATLTVTVWISVAARGGRADVKDLIEHFVRSSARKTKFSGVPTPCGEEPTDGCREKFGRACGLGASCTTTDTGDYMCACNSGYDGDGFFCKVKDPCSANPCLNGGICKANGRLYSCDCIDGFTGINCQRVFDACSTSPCMNGGRCEPVGLNYACICTQEYTGDKCQTRRRQRNRRAVCRAWGDPHYISYDGGPRHDFMGVCKYVMSESTGVATSDRRWFRVVAENEHRHGNTSVSWLKMVTIYLSGGSTVITIEKNGRVTMNGNEIVESDNDEVQIEKSRRGVIITTKDNVCISFNGDGMRIKVPQSYRNLLAGLCGNYNGDPDDDLRKRDGSMAVDYSALASSYQFGECDDTSAPEFRCTQRDERKWSGAKYCGMLLDGTGVFGNCHSVINAQAFFDACVVDMCATGGDMDVMASALTQYVTDCKDQNVGLCDWREKSGVDKFRCPQFSSYHGCASKCQDTCLNPRGSASCKDDAEVEDCVCDPGYVREGVRCVKRSECGCVQNGFYYRIGQNVEFDRSNCVCEATNSFKCTCKPKYMLVGNNCVQRTDDDSTSGVLCMEVKSEEAVGNLNDRVWFQNFVKDLSDDFEAIFRKFSGYMRAEFEARGQGLPNGRIQITLRVKVWIDVTGRGSASVEDLIRHFVQSSARKARFSGTPVKCGGSIVTDRCQQQFGTPCHENAVCVKDEGRTSYSCRCREGYVGSGRNCQRADKCQERFGRPCHEHANCVKDEGRNSYSCRCKEGYTGNGRNCQMKDPCSTKPCLNGGVCKANGKSYSCDCMAGFIGTNCQRVFDICSTSPCMNGGRCEPSGQSYSCVCSQEYTGENCQTNKCQERFGRPCHEHANCIKDQGRNSYSCRCKEGYTGNGRNCQMKDPCSSKPCLNGGVCKANGKSYSCDCLAGFIGTNCQRVFDICSTSPCMNGGRCESSGQSYFCVCSQEYTGENCQTNKCQERFGRPCHEHANCIKDQGRNSYSCRCKEGYTGNGRNCQIFDICSTLPCMNGGRCESSGQSYSCICSQEYTGENCQTNKCQERFGRPCHEQANCIKDEGRNSYSCRCKEGYTGNGRNCQMKDPCSTKPCLNGGVCKANGKSYSCDCMAGFIGTNCQRVFDICSTSPCMNGGRCEPSGQSYSCVCSQEYTGENCQTNKCQERFGRPCHEHANCIKDQGRNSYSCRCKEGYTGDGRNCQMRDPCSTKPCLNGGVCKANGKSYSCDCMAGFIGTNCQSVFDLCSTSPCMNGGRCEPSGQSYSCVCSQEYTGENCQTRRRQRKRRAVCRAWGDPHYISYDGGPRHDFMGVCKYVMSESTGVATSDRRWFRVVAENEHRHGDTSVSWLKMVTIYLSGGSTVITIEKNGRVTVNGNEIVESDNDEVQIEKSRRGVIITTKDNVCISFNGDALRIKVPESYRNLLAGLCGNYNGDPDDDLRKRDGSMAVDYSALASSYQFGECDDTSAPEFRCTQRDERKWSGAKYCGMLLDGSGVFSNCHSVINAQAFFDACVVDMCATGGNMDVMESALTQYVTDCKDQNVGLCDWRKKAGVGKFRCPNFSSYSGCASKCQDTCLNPRGSASCKDDAEVEDCVCDPGYVREGVRCVKRSECGCVQDGFYYRIGQNVEFDRSSCLCEATNSFKCTCKPKYMLVGNDCVQRTTDDSTSGVLCMEVKSEEAVGNLNDRTWFQNFVKDLSDDFEAIFRMFSGYMRAEFEARGQGLPNGKIQVTLRVKVWIDVTGRRSASVEDLIRHFVQSSARKARFSGTPVKCGGSIETNRCQQQFGTPCHENAVCVKDEGRNSYSCKCREGYVGNGRNCRRTDKCQERFGRPCHEHANCVKDEGRNSYSCRCKQGYTGNGRNCQVKDPCSAKPCLNGGVCKANGRSYSCDCMTGYIGTNCQQRSTDDSTSGVLCMEVKSEEAVGNLNDRVWFQNFVKDLSDDFEAIFRMFSGYMRAEFEARGQGLPNGRIQVTLRVKVWIDVTGRRSASVEDLIRHFVQSSARKARFSGTPVKCGGSIEGDRCQQQFGTPCHENAVCVKNEGRNSYSCRCREGYFGSGRNCQRTDKCREQFGRPCHEHANCVKDEGRNSYSCRCKEGYSGNGRNCQKINRQLCFVNLAQPCADEAFCMRQGNTYMCKCNSGYFGNGFYCDSGVWSNECHRDFGRRCGNHAQCESQGGEQFRCRCKARYEGDGFNCQPPQPPQTGGGKQLPQPPQTGGGGQPPQTGGGGQPPQTGGGGQPPQTGGGGQPDQSDIRPPRPMQPDQVENRPDQPGQVDNRPGQPGQPGQFDIRARYPCFFQFRQFCHQYATCSMDNNSGQYRCQCWRGFFGDGFHCQYQPADRCQRRFGQACHPNADCRVDRSGLYQCQCKRGYFGNGRFCQSDPRDQCERNFGQRCHSNARCRMGEDSSYRCECMDGYAGNGFNCQVQNECTRRYGIPCHQHAGCVEEGDNFYSCQCSGEYVGDGFNCRERSGCHKQTGNSCHQDAFCLDTGDGYRCQCRDGYEGNGYSDCSELFCQRPSDINQGTVSPSQGKYQVGQVIVYLCQHGHRLVGDPTRRCMPNRGWDGVPPMCVKGDEPGQSGQPGQSMQFNVGRPGQYHDQCHWFYNMPCSANGGQCTQSDGIYRCSCRDDYFGDGFHCQGISDRSTCATRYGQECHRNAECQVDALGNHQCYCRRGYRGDGFHCEGRVCQRPPDIEFGRVVDTEGVYLINHVVTYQCEGGYQLHGNTRRTCMSDGTWSGSRPLCRITDNCFTRFAQPCHHEANCISTVDGYICVCKDGYTGDGMDCKAPGCQRPRDIERGRVLSTQGIFSAGNVIAYQCDNGFTVVGDSLRTCQQDGRWTGTEPFCRPGQPGSPVVQATQPGQPAQPGDCLRYFNRGCDDFADCFETGGGNFLCHCRAGYGGNGFECQALETGQIGGHGQVEVNSRPDQPRPQDCRTRFTRSCHHFAFCRFAIDGNVECVCQEGYSGDGFDCVDDRHHATTTIGRCNPPASIPFGSIRTIDNTYKTGTIVTYSCADSYTLQGKPRRTCQSSGQWSGAEPACERTRNRRCQKPPNLQHGRVISSDGSYGDNSNVTYRCNRNYRLEGDSQRVCQNGQWSGRQPTCRRI